MPLALLLLTLANPGAPLRADLYESHLSPREGLLVPALASRGGEIYGGVRQIVSGSICLGLGLAIGAGGTYSLISAGAEPVGSSGRTVFTVLGWTFFGIGAVLALVGIPLLIVGIVRVSTKPGELGLTLDERGQLAVSF